MYVAPEKEHAVFFGYKLVHLLISRFLAFVWPGWIQ